MISLLMFPRSLAAVVLCETSLDLSPWAAESLELASASLAAIGPV